MNNAQTFAQSSDQYAKNRPQYPGELFDYLSKISPGHDAAWDCATGNGQAAVSLAGRFSRVEATDISREQIGHGIVHPRVRYSVSPAEKTSFANETFDLVTVATAVHWFDLPQFYLEVERVLKPLGVLALWTYGFFTIEPEIDRLLRKELLDPIDPFWAPGNRHALNGYRDLLLPFREISTPAFLMKVEWNLGQFLGYARTWSAVKRFASELGADPVARLESTLRPLWGAPDTVRVVHMPLSVRASRKPA